MNKLNILFPFTLGLSDGVITTLMLISRALLSGDSIGTGLALRVAFGAAFVGAFSFFIAEYSRLREEISRTSRQLVLRSPSYLIKGKIGRDILIESIIGTSVSAVSGFTGSMIPLSFSVLLPQDGLLSIAVAVVALAGLGAGIGRSVRGNYLFWVLTMVILGLMVSVIGFYLHLV
jgi:predicted membrane protein (TIGR00267 family)